MGVTKSESTVVTRITAKISFLISKSYFLFLFLMLRINVYEENQKLLFYYLERKAFDSWGEKIFMTMLKKEFSDLSEIASIENRNWINKLATKFFISFYLV